MNDRSNPGVSRRVSRAGLAGILIAGVLSVPGVSIAIEEGDGFYVRGAYAVNDIVTDDRFDRPPPNRVRTKIKYDTGDGFMGAAGFSLGQFRAELEYLRLENDIAPFSAANAETVEATAPFLNLMYVFRKNQALRPYFGGGLGYLKVETEVADESEVAVQYLLGLDAGITRNLSIDVQARYISGARYRDLDPINVGGTDNTGFIVNYDTYAAAIGLKWQFGFSPTAEPVVAAPVAAPPPAAICADAQDNDGDGLVDHPADPGCASPEDNDETDPPQCSDSKDNDGDGLIDFPADKGCTGADDKDEVDPCKSPVPGERISLKGCGTGDVIVLRGVNFEFDQSRLTLNAKSILDGVAEELVAYPEIKIELGGHTDAKGSDEYNRSLSERRAASVVAYLKGRGIADDRMSSAGYGESQPVADNETDQGRELNRRVELKVTAGVAAASMIDPAAEAAPVAPKRP